MSVNHVSRLSVVEVTLIGRCRQLNHVQTPPPRDDVPVAEAEDVADHRHDGEGTRVVGPSVEPNLVDRAIHREIVTYVMGGTGEQTDTGSGR